MYGLGKSINKERVRDKRRERREKKRNDGSED